MRHIIKETPEPFPLPTEASAVKAAAGWAHCVSVTGTFFNEIPELEERMQIRENIHFLCL